MDFLKRANELPFPVGVHPVLVVTLQPDQWHDRKGNVLKKKRYTKIWEKFERDYIDGKKKFGDTYESLVLPEYDEPDLNSTDIVKHEKYAVVDDLSIRQLNGLSEAEADKLLVGIRLLNKKGEYVSFDKVDGLEIRVEDGEFDVVATKYGQVQKELLALQKEQDDIQRDKAQVEREKKQYQENQKDNQQQQETALKTSDNNSKDVESTNSVDVYENGDKVQEVVGANVDSVENKDYSDVAELTAEEVLEADLNDYISETISPTYISDDFKHLVAEDSTDDNIKSLFCVSRDRLWTEINKGNKIIDAHTKAYQKQVREILDPLIQERLQELLDETDIQFEGSEYNIAAKAFERKYKERTQRVLEDVEAFRGTRMSKFDNDRRHYIDEVVKRETEAFNDRELPKVESEISAYEEKLKLSLEEARKIGENSINEQADDAFQKGLENLVAEVVERKEIEIERVRKNYLKDIETQQANYKIQRATEREELKKEINEYIRLSNDYNRRTDKEVEALVKSKMPELVSLEGQLKVERKAREAAEKRSQSESELANKAKKELAETNTKLDSLSQENADLESKLSTIRDEYENDDARKLKRLSLIGKYIVGATLVVILATVGTIVYVNGNNNAELRKQVESLQSEANAKYRVGEYIPVNTGDDKVVYGKITEIKKGVVTVVVTNDDGSTKSYTFNE